MKFARIELELRVLLKATTMTYINFKQQCHNMLMTKKQQENKNKKFCHYNVKHVPKLEKSLNMYQSCGCLQNWVWLVCEIMFYLS